MKKILTLGASNSSQSINKILANYTASLIPDAEITLLDLNDFEVTLYSVDRESQSGIPTLIKDFYQKISEADAIILSLAEYNGSYTSAFKNILDWATRINQKVWQNKPMLLLSTSPGGRGGATVLESAKQTFPHLGAQVIATFSLPSFHENFSTVQGIQNPEFKEAHQKAVATILSNL